MIQTQTTKISFLLNATALIKTESLFIAWLELASISILETSAASNSLIAFLQSVARRLPMQSSSTVSDTNKHKYNEIGRNGA